MVISENRRSFIIGICGGSGSGKTTLAAKLEECVGTTNAVVLSQDSYYRDLSHMDQDERESVNFDHPAALEWDLLHSHLMNLKMKKGVNAPEYDYVSHTRKGVKKVCSADLVLLEGHLIFHEEMIRDLIDLKIYLHLDSDILLLRRIQRDMAERGRSLESVIHQYLSTVRPIFLDFVLPCMCFADMTFNFDGSPDEFVNRIVKYLDEKNILTPTD